MRSAETISTAPIWGLLIDFFRFPSRFRSFYPLPSQIAFVSNINIVPTPHETDFRRPYCRSQIVVPIHE